MTAGVCVRTTTAVAGGAERLAAGGGEDWAAGGAGGGEGGGRCCGADGAGSGRGPWAPGGAGSGAGPCASAEPPPEASSRQTSAGSRPSRRDANETPSLSAVPLRTAPPVAVAANEAYYTTINITRVRCAR